MCFWVGSPLPGTFALPWSFTLLPPLELRLRMSIWAQTTECVPSRNQGRRVVWTTGAWKSVSYSNRLGRSSLQDGCCCWLAFRLFELRSQATHFSSDTATLVSRRVGDGCLSQVFRFVFGDTSVTWALLQHSVREVWGIVLLGACKYVWCWTRQAKVVVFSFPPVLFCYSHLYLHMGLFNS